MKSDTSAARSVSASISNSDDSSKLISLLALAAGALAMPQTSNADVIFNDLGANFVTIGPGGTNSFLIDNLPGTARLEFASLHNAQNTSRVVTARLAGGYVRLRTHSSFALMAGLGATWDQIKTPNGTGTVLSNRGLIAKVDAAGHFPNSFIHLYLSFKFKDSTQVPPNDRYGWVDLSLSNPGGAAGPDVTVFKYAFETTGATIAMGIVPEPGSTSLLALGALTLGASGLRSWRRKRAAASQV